jgi:hypothetical protein
MKISKYYVFSKNLQDKKSGYVFITILNSYEEVKALIEVKGYDNCSLMVLKGIELELEEEIAETLVPLTRVKSRKFKNA